MLISLDTGVRSKIYCRGRCTFAKTAAVRRESQNGGLISRYIPFLNLIQREAFSRFSMRNRGILEKEPDRSRSDREPRLQKEVQYAAEEPHSCQNESYM